MGDRMHVYNMCVRPRTNRHIVYTYRVSQSMLDPSGVGDVRCRGASGIHSLEDNQQKTGWGKYR